MGVVESIPRPAWELLSEHEKVCAYLLDAHAEGKLTLDQFHRRLRTFRWANTYALDLLDIDRD